MWNPASIPHPPWPGPARRQPIKQFEAGAGFGVQGRSRGNTTISTPYFSVLSLSFRLGMHAPDTAGRSAGSVCRTGQHRNRNMTRPSLAPSNLCLLTLCCQHRLQAGTAGDNVRTDTAPSPRGPHHDCTITAETAPKQSKHRLLFIDSVTEPLQLQSRTVSAPTPIQYEATTSPSLPLIRCPFSIFPTQYTG